jgi:hypothetical protein
LAALGLVASTAGAAEVETLRQSGAVTDRFNIAVLGDGYRAEDQAKLKTDAQGIIDYVLGVSPLKQYAQFFNVKLVHVISNENGADNGSYGAMRDMALGGYFNCDGIDRLLCIDDGLAAVAAAQDVPEYNFVIVIVNDPKYGGSGGPVGVSSSNEQSFEVLAHEIGHSLAHLADEYSYEGNQPPCNAQADCSEANATLRTTREQIKWRDWIEQTTPLPTPATDPYAAVTGLFEGARYTPTGVYRPQLNCKMRDLGAEYCSVCSEQFVRSIWTFDNIKMIESTTPAAPQVSSATCDAIALSVKSPPITPSTYRYTWSVDGKLLADAGSGISLQPGVLSQGDHTVDLTIEDATDLVRTDTAGVLKDQFSWSVSVAKSDCPVAGGGTAGGAAGASGAAGVGGGGAGGAGGMAGSAGAEPVAGANAAGVGAGPSNGGSGAGAAPLRNPPPRETSGCGCSLPRRGDSRALGWAALAFALVARRRRTKRAAS